MIFARKLLKKRKFKDRKRKFHLQLMESLFLLQLTPFTKWLNEFESKRLGVFMQVANSKSLPVVHQRSLRHFPFVLFVSG